MLDLGITWTLGALSGNAPRVRPLTPVVEHRPQIPLDTRRVDPAQPRDWEHLYPLLIGLGAMAERILDHLPAQLALPHGAGLYRTGLPMDAAPDVPHDLAWRLAHSFSAVLLVDAADPQALVDAAVWARQLAPSDSTLRATVVLNALAPDVAPAWRATLPPPVIEVVIMPEGCDPAAIVAALLPVLFQETPGVIAVDARDVRQLLDAGQTGQTTAVRWMPSDRFPLAIVAHAATALLTDRTRGVLVGIRADPTFTLAAFDQLLNQLNDQLSACGNPELPVVVSWHTSPSGTRVRELSLTALGT